VAEALQTPYVSVANADIYNSGDIVWEAATTEEKDEALLIGRMYIDTNYLIISGFPEDDAPIAVQKSNAVLGKYYINDPSNFFNEASGSNIKIEKVKVDDLLSETEKFAPQNSDKYPYITALLSPYMTFNQSIHFVDR